MMLHSFFGVKDESDLYLPRGRSLHKASRTSSYQVQRGQRRQIQRYESVDDVRNDTVTQPNNEADWQSDEEEEEEENNADDFDRRSNRDENEDDEGENQDEDEDEDGKDANAPLLPISSTDSVAIKTCYAFARQYQC